MNSDQKSKNNLFSIPNIDEADHVTSDSDSDNMEKTKDSNKGNSSNKNSN